MRLLQEMQSTVHAQSEQLFAKDATVSESAIRENGLKDKVESMSARLADQDESLKHLRTDLMQQTKLAADYKHAASAQVSRTVKLYVPSCLHLLFALSSMCTCQLRLHIYMQAWHSVEAGT